MSQREPAQPSGDRFGLPGAVGVEAPVGRLSSASASPERTRAICGAGSLTGCAGVHVGRCLSLIQSQTTENGAPEKPEKPRTETQLGPGSENATTTGD